MPDVLQQWLLNIATRAPQEWHAYDRLALADYLEERGDPRAAFVRGDSPCRDDIEVVSATGATGKIPGLIDGHRERRRLLGLFPDVALEGPCPDHRGLPEGVEALYYDAEGVDPGKFKNYKVRRILPGYCFACGGSGSRASSARDWLPGGTLAVLALPAGRVRGVFGCRAKQYRWHITVWVPAGGPSFDLPTDRRGYPLVVPPSLTPDGRPVCPAPPG